MSASKTNFLRSKMYQSALKATPYTGPATIYMALHTGAPGVTGASNEVPSTNAYVRTAIVFGTDTNGAGSNSAAVTFPTPTPSAWGTLTYFSLWDAATAGNCLYQDALTASVVTSAGVAVSFPIASVAVSET
jgi:hypothetical protein